MTKQALTDRKILESIIYNHKGGPVGIDTLSEYTKRFGLGSKDFTPAMVKAVYENAVSDNPIFGFSVGIDDDVTHKSLKFDASWIIPLKSYNAMFYGLGSDGTVGANKNTAKIINSFKKAP